MPSMTRSARREASCDLGPLLQVRAGLMRLSVWSLRAGRWSRPMVSPETTRTENGWVAGAARTVDRAPRAAVERRATEEPPFGDPRRTRHGDERSSSACRITVA